MLMFPLCSFSLVVSISKTAKNTGKEILVWCFMLGVAWVINEGVLEAVC